MEGNSSVTKKLIPYIVDKFQLFEGTRTPDEDKRILDKILAHCFFELLLMMPEKLPKEECEKLKNEIDDLIDNNGQESSGAITDVFQRYLDKANISGQEMSDRFEKKVDQVFDQTIK